MTALASLLVTALLLTTSAAPELEFEEEFDIWIEELPGGAVSPGGAIDFRFEYSYDGERLLFWGWTGPNDIRVMDRDLTLIKGIELPTEDWEVHGARWDHLGSVIVWGHNGTGPDDTLLVYQYPDLELDTSFLPREVIPISTIDSAMLLADGLIMVVVGRDENGTSQIITLETRTDSVRSTHNVHGNLTIQTTGVLGDKFIALDVEGGATTISTYDWTYHDRIVDIEGPYAFARLRTNHPWILGGQNGRVLIKEDYMLNRTFDMTFDVPAQAACWVKSSLANNFIVALPKAGGGSIIQVYHDRNGSIELGGELETKGTVTTMYSVIRVRFDPERDSVISVGFGNGEFKQYNVTSDLQLTPIYPPDPGDKDDGDGDGKWQSDNRRYIPGTVILIVVAVLAVRYYLKRGTKDQ